MLPTNLTFLTAKELRTALIIATREKNEGDRQKVLAEHRRRGIKP